MPAAVAVPAIASLASAGIGYLGSRQSNDQQALTAQQRANAVQQGDLAKKLTELAGQQSTLARPAYEKGLDYFSSLSGAGGKAKAIQAVTPDLNRLNEQYRGTADRINMSLTGPARDRALGDLVRQHAMQAAELTGAPRREANAALLNAGKQGLDSATNLYGAASGAYGGAASATGSALGQANNREQQLGSLFGSLGENFAKLWAPYLKGQGGTKSVSTGGSSASSYSAWRGEGGW